MLSDLVIADCLEFLRALEDGVASLVFADPPFNVKKPYATYVDHKERQEYEDWSRQWILELVRVLRPGGSLFLHNIPYWLIRQCYFLDTLEEMSFCHWIAWDALSAPMGESLQPAHYGIAYYVKRPLGKVTFHELRIPHKRCRTCKNVIARYDGENVKVPPHGPLITDVWKDIYRLKHKEYRTHHPCQLPVHLLERIILMSSEAGDLVVDPFVGTGASAVAAARLGRAFTGCDLDEGYVAVSRERVERQIQQSLFNGMYISCHLRDMITVRRDDIYDLWEKKYRQPWKDLFRSWPDTDEEWIRLNDKPPKLKREYTKLLDVLNGQIKKARKQPI